SGARTHAIRTAGQLEAEAASFGGGAATAATDRFLGLVPLSHAHGLSNALVAALHAGGTLVLQERFDRRATLRLLERERVTVFPAVPFMLSILADTRMAAPVDLSTLRLCFTAGAPLAAGVWTKVRERFGIAVGQLYGSTETGALTLNAAGLERSRLSVG